MTVKYPGDEWFFKAEKNAIGGMRQDEQRDPWEEEDGGENFAGRYRFILQNFCNKCDSSLETSVDAGSEGRYDGDEEEKIESIGISGDVKLQCRLRKRPE